MVSLEIIIQGMNRLRRDMKRFSKPWRTFSSSYKDGHDIVKKFDFHRWDTI